jgi:hypothetical protein
MNILNFGFYIGIPFWPWKWTSFWDREIAVSKNKTLLLQFMRSGSIIGFAFRWNIRQDHAGAMLNLELLGFELLVELSDNRHWDDNTGTWEVYE